MIGIIVAMESELEALCTVLGSYYEKDINGEHFYLFKYQDKELVAALSGVGKVAMASCATQLILTYQPELLINVGVAGSLKRDIKTLDLVVATCVTQHDLIVPGWNIDRITYQMDKELLKIAKKIKYQNKVFGGQMLSGDLFVEQADGLRLAEQYPEALAVEMEAGALAQVSQKYSIPCLIFRCISDVTIEPDNMLSFDLFEKKAALLCSSYVYEFIKEVL